MNRWPDIPDRELNPPEPNHQDWWKALNEQEREEYENWLEEMNNAGPNRTDETEPERQDNRSPDQWDLVFK